MPKGSEKKKTDPEVSGQMQQGVMPWIDLNIPYWDYMTNGDSFEERGLNKPGTLIRMANGKEYLIGHINPRIGICDDCTEFDSEDIVAAYKVIWEEA